MPAMVTSLSKTTEIQLDYDTGVFSHAVKYDRGFLPCQITLCLRSGEHIACFGLCVSAKSRASAGVLWAEYT